MQGILPLPTPVCAHCWSTEYEWVEACGRVKVITFTVVHQVPSQAFADDLPYVLAVIGLEEGPQMMANVVGRNGCGSGLRSK